MRVIDSSVLVDALVTNAQRARTLRGLLDDGTPLSAPHLVDLEVTNTIRRLLRHGRLDLAAAERAITGLQRLPLVRHSHDRLLARCWELRENVTPYHAAYVALAEALGVPLLTADARLASAPGIRCEVELLT